MARQVEATIKVEGDTIYALMQTLRHVSEMLADEDAWKGQGSVPFSDGSSAKYKYTVKEN